MLIMLLVLLSSSAEAVPLQDGDFEQSQPGWVMDRGVTRTPRPAAGSPDTNSGGAMVMYSGGFRSAQPILPKGSGEGRLDISLSGLQISAAESELFVDLVTQDGTTLASGRPIRLAGQWSRRRIALPPLSPEAPAAYLQIRRSGDVGILVVDNVAVEQLVDTEPGFVSLFDGTSLQGWIGDTAGYEVVEGAIRCKPGSGGDLRTQDRFGDFVLRFEFKLSPGANNGIAIRAPVVGNAAYEGIEVQVLDSPAPGYANLKPWQYHGSAYGLAAAKRGWLLPSGSWNREEIHCEGSHLTVTLNGHRILETDLDAVLAAGPPSGHTHPGAANREGHVGFCGHGSDVAFRNLRIKPILPLTAPAN